MLVEQMQETMACEVCGKPKEMSLDECHKTFGRKNPLCNDYHNCRIEEKSEHQLNYAFSDINENIFLKACPGSGKTEVVGLKTAYEIKRWEKEVGGIAVLTFTNNAADVISERASQFAGIEKIKYPHFIGTFDSWLHGYIAHPFGHFVTGYQGKEEDHSIRLISKDENGKWLNAYKMKTSYSYYKKNKQKIIYRNGVPVIASLPIYANNVTQNYQNDDWEIKISSFNDPIKLSEYYVSDLFIEFRSDKKWLTLDYLKSSFQIEKEKFFRAGFATYQDIENICFKLLSEQKRLTERIARRFPLIIVDECQDLSWIQLQILKLIKDKGSKLHFVGDLNQSIYGFKEVEPEDIKKFISAEELKENSLSNNYRSCQSIVDLCQKLVKEDDGVVGKEKPKAKKPCLYLVYENESDISKLPGWFENRVKQEGLEIKESTIITKGWSNVNRMRSCGDDTKINNYFKRLAMAIYLWETEGGQAIKDAIKYMGQFFAEKYFDKYEGTANSRNYYCPECIDSPIKWRMFLGEVLSKCVKSQNLIDFDKTSKEWAKSVWEEFGQIAIDCKPLLEGTISKDVNVTFSEKLVYSRRAPNKKTQISFQPPNKVRDVAVRNVISVNSVEKSDICITTIHSVKGKTYDAVMVVSAPNTSKGSSKDNHWEHWLHDGNEAAARLAYVASSRPRYLLVWAVPKSKRGDMSKLSELGFELVSLEEYIENTKVNSQ